MQLLRGCFVHRGLDVSSPTLFPTFVGKTNIYCGEKGAVWSYQGVERVKKNDDNFIRAEQIGYCEGMDGC